MFEGVAVLSSTMKKPSPQVTYC